MLAGRAPLLLMFWRCVAALDQPEVRLPCGRVRGDDREDTVEPFVDDAPTLMLYLKCRVVFLIRSKRVKNV